MRMGRANTQNSAAADVLTRSRKADLLDAPYTGMVAADRAKVTK